LPLKICTPYVLGGGPSDTEGQPEERNDVANLPLPELDVETGSPETTVVAETPDAQTTIAPELPEPPDAYKKTDSKD
jgi:hypothetical protein